MKFDPSTLSHEDPLNRPDRAIVIGASSGSGAALVRRLAGEGMLVAALARREDLLQKLAQEINEEHGEMRCVAYVHDVVQSEKIPDLFAQILADLGSIEAIVYAAGVQPGMAIDEFDWTKDSEMIAVNIAGAVAWLGMAADFFVRMRHGQIVGITSLAGDRGRVANPVYSSTKAALDTYLESLRNRLTRHGVHVLTVKPGFVDTVLLNNAPRTFGVISPDRAALGIWKAMKKGDQLIYLPWWWRWIMLAIRFTPSFIFRRLSF